MKSRRGFTFIELLITLSIIAICFLPLMHMFTASIEQVYVTGDLITARYLAQEAMERVKNLGFTKEQLTQQGDVWEPSLDEPAFVFNKKKWRVLRTVTPYTGPLELHIQVYRVFSKTHEMNPSNRPLVELVTLIEDLDWVTVE